MKKFRLFFTVLLLLASLAVILLIAIFDNVLLFRAAQVIKDNIWPAAIASLIFLILLITAIVTTLSESKGSLFSNGYFQLAILELFLCTTGLAYYRHYIQQPGQIILQLAPANERESINLVLKSESRKSTPVDTISAPGHIRDLPAGNYSIETLDRDILYFQTEVYLEPAEIETLVIPVTLNTKTLTVQTEPPGAEIRLNGLQASFTPYTFNILIGDSVILELSMEGYQLYKDTLHLTENMNLGIIPLQKLYSLRVSCLYSYTTYKIYDMDDKVLLSASGSRKLQLSQGKYRIAYEIGEGQYDTKIVLLNNNKTVAIP